MALCKLKHCKILRFFLHYLKKIFFCLQRKRDEKAHFDEEIRCGDYHYEPVDSDVHWPPIQVRKESYKSHNNNPHPIYI